MPEGPQVFRSQWLIEPLPADVRVALDRLARAPDVRRIAVMPDVHLSRDVCIGTVVATTSTLYPQAVGGDIGCGMATVKLCGADARVPSRAEADALFVALRAAVPVVRHRQGRTLSVARSSLSPLAQAPRLWRDLAVQLGTVGRGNHFVELQLDQDGELWLLVHSGSRALGPWIRDQHVRAVGVSGRRLIALPDGEPGRAYLQDHDAAMEFARHNRRECTVAALAALREVLGQELDADWQTSVDTVHNFVRRELHGGEWLWVHRKGASSARSGEAGIVPGSMGTATVHVTGRGNAASMASSSHGAGRCMARGEAMRRITRRELARDLEGVFFEAALGDRLRDEAPAAYKDLGKVMRAQRDLVRVARRLRPVLVYKGT